ncbi:MAG: FCD domain-containing protein [Mycobacterium sp.]
MRRGPNGGLIVEAPDGRSAINALIVYLEFIDTSTAHILQARTVLEPLAAELVARHVSEDDVAELRFLLRNDAAEESRRADPFHKWVGDHCANPVVALLTDVLGVMTERYVRAPWRAPVPAVVAELQADAIGSHRAIADAVASGDSALARVRMSDHLDAVTTILAHDPAHRAPRRGPRFRDSPAGPNATLAEQLAGRMFDDITRQGWPTGEVLGSQPELMTTYGVGRAVLRAAIRLLEIHSVAMTRRGPGGGLVVMRPDQRAGIEASSVYLSFRGTTAHDLDVVRDAIALGAVEILGRAAWPSDSKTIHELQDAESKGVVALQLSLVHATENPVLCLFFDILIDLMDRLNAGQHINRATAGDATAKARVVSALAQHNWPLAQRRLRALHR